MYTKGLFVLSRVSNPGGKKPGKALPPGVKEQAKYELLFPRRHGMLPEPLRRHALLTLQVGTVGIHFVFRLRHIGFSIGLFFEICSAVGLRCGDTVRVSGSFDTLGH